MSSPCKVLVVAGDPGGAAAVTPVLRRLTESAEWDVCVVAYAQAIEVWGRAGFSVAALAGRPMESVAAACLHDHACEVLLTATSYNGTDWERTFWKAARSAGIPSLAVLDFWCNYRPRFQNELGLLACPDRIAVMDETAGADMRAQGFSPSCVVVTGQPAFDDLDAWKAGVTDGQRAAWRRAWHTPEGGKLVTFISQPFEALYGDDVTRAGHPGYLEQHVLASLRHALEREADAGSTPVRLIVRPHPREADIGLPASSVDRFSMVATREGVLRELLMASDLVVGMNSVALLEACYLGQPVLSLQPGLRIPDPLPTNRCGASRGVFEEREIEAAVHELLADGAAREALQHRAAQFRPPGQATDRVIGVLETLMARARAA